jgi:hypothetical protein
VFRLVERRCRLWPALRRLRTAFKHPLLFPSSLPLRPRRLPPENRAPFVPLDDLLLALLPMDEEESGAGLLGGKDRVILLMAEVHSRWRRTKCVFLVLAYTVSFLPPLPSSHLISRRIKFDLSPLLPS